MLAAKKKRRKAASARAPAFAALGDPTRLALVAKLCRGESYSIAALTEGSGLTRQAMTKHLRVLEGVGIVRCVRRGRERLFAFNPEPVDEMRATLEFVSQQWDEALGRLKRFVEG
jgi:DNA-binding transcriptional ArsR family regulator